MAVRDVVKFAVDTNVRQGLNLVVWHIAVTPEEVKYAFDKYIEAYPELTIGGSKLANENRYPEDWEFLTATSSIVLASRWKILWEYVLLGRRPLFTVEAWFHPKKEGRADIGDLKVYVKYQPK